MVTFIQGNVIIHFLSNDALYFVFLPESQVQLGPGDGGNDSRLFFLGLHRDTNPGRIHILQARSEQVGGT